VVAYFSVNSEFVRGDKNAESAYDTRQYGGWVGYRMDMPVVGAERRGGGGISMPRQVICRHSDGAHLGPAPVWTAAGTGGSSEL
jgi:hypothetical protein